MQISQNDPWKKAQITNRAGKATGKNYNWWNVTNQDGSKQAIDLTAINCWRIPDSLSNSIPKLVDKNPEATDKNMEQLNDEKTIDEVFIAQSKEEEIKAKLTELEHWKSREVYKEVKDTGQECIPFCWVIKLKIINNKPGTKTRLYAHGFEEERNYPTDSPTCSRECLQIMYTLCSSIKWPVNSIDIKTAFLQGKDLECTVFVRPPKEPKPTKSGNYKNVYMDWLMHPVLLSKNSR